MVMLHSLHSVVVLGYSIPLSEAYFLNETLKKRNRSLLSEKKAEKRALVEAVLLWSSSTTFHIGEMG